MLMTLLTVFSGQINRFWRIIVQPRSQGLSSPPPLSTTTIETEKRDPGNEIGTTATTTTTLPSRSAWEVWVQNFKNKIGEKGVDI